MSTAPRSRPAAAGAAVVLGLLLVLLAVVGVHDLAVDQGWAGGSSWLTTAAGSLDGTRPGTAAVAIAVVVGLVGLWLLVLAIRPARRTHRRTPLDGGVWISRRATARLATRAAEQTPGVESASASVGRRSVTVRADVSSASDETAGRVRRAVERALHDLSADRIRITTREVSHDA